MLRLWDGESRAPAVLVRMFQQHESDKITVRYSQCQYRFVGPTLKIKSRLPSSGPLLLGEQSRQRPQKRIIFSLASNRVWSSMFSSDNQSSAATVVLVWLKRTELSHGSLSHYTGAGLSVFSPRVNQWHGLKTRWQAS